MYGGTKAELERLVKDANEYKESIGEVGDLSSDNFADVIQAINAIQRKIGITGATASEAMGTIQGSVNMAKAAWDNWLSGLGTEGADMGQLTSQLVESIGAVADNVGPAVQRIGTALASQLPSAISGAVSAVAPIAAEAIAGIFNSVGGALDIGLPQINASDILATFSQIGSALAPMLSGIASTIQSVMPSIVEGFQGLVSSIGPTIQTLVTNIGPPLANLVQTVMPPLMGVLSSILPLLASIASAILPPIINYLTPIISLVMQIASAVIPPLTAAIQFLTPVIQIVISAVMTLIPIFSGLMGVINALTTPITSIGAVLLPQMSSAFSFLQGPLNAAIGIFNAVVGALTPIVSTLGSIISLAGQAASAIASIGGGIIGGIGSFLGFARGGFTSGPYIAGEDPRYPNEAVISFNPAYRAQNLRYWAMAGHMLGASPSVQAASAPASGGGGVSIDMSGMTFAPSVEVRGNASKDDIVAAIRQCEAEFVDFVSDALARRGESAYAV